MCDGTDRVANLQGPLLHRLGADDDDDDAVDVDDDDATHTTSLATVH